MHPSHKLLPINKAKGKIANLSFRTRLTPEGKERGEWNKGVLEAAGGDREGIKGGGSGRMRR